MVSTGVCKVQIFWEGKKIWKLSSTYLCYSVASNVKWKIFSNFVTFSYLNFNMIWMFTTLIMYSPFSLNYKISTVTKVSSSYHLCVKCFSQLSFDSEVYTKSATAVDFLYTSESNEKLKNIRRKDDRITSLISQVK